MWGSARAGTRVPTRHTIGTEPTRGIRAGVSLITHSAPGLPVIDRASPHRASAERFRRHCVSYTL